MSIEDQGQGYRTIGPLVLPPYHYACNAKTIKGAASAILMPLVWRGYDSNPQPTAPEADALLLELSGPSDR